ncbi:helix-turn-helix domain-containing protein [Neobacillus sp. DY30]|uniref:PucR family transcriptional regulator n=1 Tax=Neobacillus sp. DY30 TaxID=3047871 RepID=UPI0024BF7B49|nr:helix-turn-helix domain-containing protein [Neobacillus sp. DY30]WHY01998.1 helix-turn-helix domain-containing protein [Neobacillus sp. DY30]
MLKNLMSLYANSILYTEQPQHTSDQFYIFFDVSQKQWLAIPKSSLTEKEVTLLQTLYEQVKIPAKPLTTLSKKWHDFLLLNGSMPSLNEDSNFRFIQFHIQGRGVDPTEMEPAIKGFFSDEVQIIWEDDHNGIVIEETKHMSLTESELTSIADTLESDFYVKISFYFGKVYLSSSYLRSHFQQEKEYFEFAKEKLEGTNILTFEKVFPAFVAFNLPEYMKEKIKMELSSVFSEDPELYTTIKIFLENNLNASLTAKKLYIHRNTLQYRIDKFIDKTGVQLKDFYGAFTVFLACLLYEQRK